jgi:hypothetical protein
MGWSSWNAFEVNINDSIICHHADLLVKKGLKDCGYKYVNIDDGFFGMRDANGRMTGHATRFPNGLRNTVDYIHGLGLKAGIYTDAGTRTCGSFGNGEKTGMGAGIYGHERQDAQLYFNDWDFDFIKIDYCGGGHLLLDEQERYTDIYNAIKATAHKPISMNICRWAFPGTWAKDIAASWRISGDIRADWNSIKYIVGKNMYLSAFAGDGHFNDMDMLVIGLAKRGVGGKGLTPLEEETHFGLWCIMSSPLLIGADLNDIPEPSLNLLKNKELIALNQDPLGLQAYAVQHEGDSYVFVKDITTRRGLTRAVALYNESDTVHSFCVPLSELELGGKTSVRDLVHHKNLGTYKNEINFKVPAHNTMVLKLTAQERLEPIQYEAEWAYLPLYNDLGKSKGICTQQKNNASGRTIISYLGGKPDNYLEWKDVYSKDGGSYKLNISYYSSDLRSLEVTVNGQKQTLKNLGGKDGDERKQVSVNVNLKAGYNVIRLGNDFNWAPDIDCITVEKL